MILCGHRGVASLAPENTLAGLRKAAELGLSWVEIDVQLTKDEKVVVIHDEKVNRCSDGKGKLRKYAWDELRKLDAGSWFDPAFAQERIPKLKDYLALARELGIRVNVELKVYDKDDAGRLCRKVSKLIDKHGVDKDSLLFSSFDPDCLRYLQVLQPEVPRGLLVEHIPDDWQQQLEQLECAALHCNYRYLSREQAEAVKAAGYRLHCYTANTPDKVKDFPAWGVDMLFTDKPQDYLDAGWSAG
ncbi:glycerophosphoryl diester phosphodiesterase [Zobellella denitrificans]|jgi:glycerophosphoryl diester phosphodiesterase|uniref:Glycerophosphodiester phosphodiesterase n=1 Tax=Zobellella denitrificans TaxID=347534 RepID=A0A231MTY3_9GAMM|nr:glycerophosphoryl diester phosphodiesterase [Zobellella denitrificans]ATG74839.1 glycerophosphodiester phosphodiesterase [Zobellella denitrificans]OXS13674.1 glycerophosphoryl diester phosphodiesterase [Zobellella denitrificans]